MTPLPTPIKHKVHFKGTVTELNREVEFNGNTCIIPALEIIKLVPRKRGAEMKQVSRFLCYKDQQSTLLIVVGSLIFWSNKLPLFTYNSQKDL